MSEVNFTQRDKLQERAGQIWLESNQMATIILGTGVGKSKLAIDIMSLLDLPKDAKILLLSNSESLRDDNWREDFIKWGKESLWKNVRSECYQTAYKWVNTEWDLIIADEIDFAMTPEYAKFFFNNKLKRVLGLTGTITPEKEANFLNKIAPVIFQYSTQDAQKANILNQTQLVLVEFNLSRNKNDITVKYKKGGKEKSFTQSENDAYEYADRLYNVSVGTLEKYRDDINVTLGMDPDGLRKMEKAERDMKTFSRKRKEILYNSKAAQTVARTITNKVLECPNSKVLTFSQFTEQANQICKHTVHSNNDKKTNDKHLAWFKDGKIRDLGTCKSLNRGENIPDLNALLIESYDGSTTSFQQRHGRGVRLRPDQTMYLYVLLPYFLREVKDKDSPTGKSWKRNPTQAVAWAESMMEGFEFKNPIRISL
jgi:superfamily II DNA or RNA helicase